jgi:hypothetical protein
MSIHNDSTVCSTFGKFVPGTILAIENALNSVDQSIRLIFIKKSEEFVLQNSKYTKKEVVFTALSSNIYYYWKPVVQAKGDSDGDITIKLARTADAEKIVPRSNEILSSKL